MKTLITYYSSTGNTEKVAKAIHKAVEDKKEIVRVDQVGSLDGFDLILFGFPVHHQGVPTQIEKSIKKMPAGKLIAFFTTHGSLTGSRMSTSAIEHAVSLAARVTVIGSFSCRGRVAKEYIGELQKRPDHRGWIDVVDSAKSHPNQSDLDDAAMFAKLMVVRAEAKLDM